jgi:hypothetical protein
MDSTFAACRAVNSMASTVCSVRWQNIVTSFNPRTKWRAFQKDSSSAASLAALRQGSARCASSHPSLPLPSRHGLAVYRTVLFVRTVAL